MKIILASMLAVFTLVGCTKETTTTEQLSSSQPVEESKINENVTSERVINFSGENNSVVQLKTTDNFETAELKVNSTKTYNLKRVISGSGIKLADESGTSIHFKDHNGTMEGTVEIVPGETISVKESK